MYIGGEYLDFIEYFIICGKIWKKRIGYYVKVS